MSPRKQVEREFVQQWLAKAAEDLGVAEHLSGEEVPYLGAVCFHAQQAAEKYLKAALVRFQVEFPKTHDLKQLLDLLAPCSTATVQALEDIIALNAYSVDTRYPGDWPDLAPEDSRTAVDLAKKTQAAVLTLLGEYLGR